MLILKVLQVNILDEIRAWTFRQNGKGKFNITNFVIFSLFWQTLLAGHFFLYNFIYYSQIDPCFGTTTPTQASNQEYNTLPPTISSAMREPSSESLQQPTSPNLSSALPISSWSLQTRALTTIKFSTLWQFLELPGSSSFSWSGSEQSWVLTSIRRTSLLMQGRKR